MIAKKGRCGVCINSWHESRRFIVAMGLHCLCLYRKVTQAIKCHSQHNYLCTCNKGLDTSYQLKKLKTISIFYGQLQTTHLIFRVEIFVFIPHKLRVHYLRNSPNDHVHDFPNSLYVVYSSYLVFYTDTCLGDNSISNPIKLVISNALIAT